MPKTNIAPLSYTSQTTQNVRVSYGRRVFPWAFSYPCSNSRPSSCRYLGKFWHPFIYLTQAPIPFTLRHTFGDPEIYQDNDFPYPSLY